MERLRSHLRRHNRRVLALTIGTFVVVVALWAVLYFVAWWMFVLAAAIAKPFDFQPTAGPLLRVFVATVGLLCACAWWSRFLRPNQAPKDYKSPGEHFLDVVLAVPRLTLAIFGTGGAAARLNDGELEHAWNLLRQMNERDLPVHVSELPVDIPDPAMRHKIVLALQLSGLVEIRPGAGGPVFAFPDDQARRLAQERVRLRT